MTIGGFANVAEEQAATLVARDYKNPQVVNDSKTASGKEVFGTLAASMGAKQWLGNQEAFSGDYHIVESEYLVRRLTPQECAMLQGFPIDWCAGLGTLAPSDGEIAFWEGVFGTHARINGKKPRSRKQIIKWLAYPYSDAAEYKLWGNGVALPCACAVMAGIAWVAGTEA